MKTFELANVDMFGVVSKDAKHTLLGMVRQDEALRRYRKEVLFRSEK